MSYLRKAVSTAIIAVLVPPVFVFFLVGMVYFCFLCGVQLAESLVEWMRES